MELASISGLEREKERQYLLFVSVTVNGQKYLCIGLQPTFWIKSKRTTKQKCSVEQSFDADQHVT
jgi:hypothetical protein